MNRICQSCATAKKSASSTSDRSNAAKRKEGGGFLKQNPPKKRQGEVRKRLTLGQKREEQPEIVEALSKEATDVLNERVNGTFTDDANPSDNELELDGTEKVEGEGGRRLAPPPPFSELSSFFGPLEKYAESCGISGAGYYLRKAKMSFIAARSSKPAVQADIRAMFSDS